MAFSVQQRCPSCRRSLHRSRDVVHTKPEAKVGGTAFMRQLRDTLLGRTGRCLVVSSHGDLHERLAMWLRSEGVQDSWAWRGNTKMIVRTLQRFEHAARGVLLVDPTSLSLSWAVWPKVDRVLLLWPLEEGGDMHACCQIKQALEGLQEPRPTVSVFGNGSSLPRCGHRGCRGPSFVFS
jgi:hypothetical protein